ncbi:conserved hypothetical protein [Culex quinquefasciatus]|uniref:Uncharacterized protein n=1 Tax=Culex quinquefasciatus TaxID=7176 RepID=B0XL05_CULQU|nr:conserved hypothetical protein [Culex quinquefasciatus]|eukprot:XP_001870327.1 conserved hypothetical protein [Culex quinquefasciatus]
MVDGSEENMTVNDEVVINQVEINIEKDDGDLFWKQAGREFGHDVDFERGAGRVQQASTLVVFRNAHEMELTCADIMLLCDLFYLPFEHGSKALQLLAEFH